MQLTQNLGDMITPLCASDKTVLQHFELTANVATDLYPPQSRFKPSHGGEPWDLGYESWYKRTRIPTLPSGENHMIIWSLVLTQ